VSRFVKHKASLLKSLLSMWLRVLVGGASLVGEGDVVDRIARVAKELKSAMVGGFGFSSAKARLKKAREHS